ncbi:DUF4179 domain-containing protein [Cytobacillus purgationiresistens]|uniref:DUF4179 domain-containing protein n=1 Tax=Cytobacillus purgationiresistens TaxID=863449 RepID=A0ABU0AHB7_9BACI|nr:DUF4179 domain-containing protein [Cytobacillus purgationiresistens]MDQ0270632.1 hypothetical protein [Cytobacillus purgationiresistens]
MDKKQMKNLIEQIDVPRDDVFNAIDRGIKRDRNIKPFIKKKIIISSSVSAALISITLISGLFNPTMNRVLAGAPIIGGIFEQFGDQMGMQLAQQDSVTELNQTVTKEGVTVQLNQAYFDGNVVSILGHVSGELNKGKNEEGELSFDVNFEENKGDDDPWLSSMSTDVNSKAGGYDFQWKLVYPYTTIDEDFLLPITIHHINGIKGGWTFNTPISQMKNKTIALDHTESYPDERVQISLNEMKIAKASSTLSFQTVSDYKGDQIDFKKAVDEKGNILFNYANNTTLAQSKNEEGYTQSLRKSIDKIGEDVQTITFYPFMSITEPPVQQLLDASSFTLGSERSDLRIEVNNITEKDDQVIIDYQFNGKMSNHRLDLLLNNLKYSFALIDQDFVGEIDLDNPILPEKHSISSNEVTLIDKKTYQFQSVFQLNGEEQIDNFSLENTILQFDFSSFIEQRELAPFTVELSK